MEKFDFSFYIKFTKPLILNLPALKDRILASAWVKVLIENEKIEPATRLEYLKLFLFVLQRKKLAPPFTQHPSTVDRLEELPKDKTLVEVAKGILESEQEERRERDLKRLKDESHWPAYVSDFSADLLEYVSVQNIEDFGVHGYYAISKEPLPTWYRVDKESLPKAAKSMLEVSPPPPTFLDSQSSPRLPPEKSPEQAKEPPVDIPPSEEAPKEPAAKAKSKTPRKSGLGSKPPAQPLGKVCPPSEDRDPPTWGSNLLQANVLDEEVADLIKESTNLGQFTPDPAATEVIASPMTVLYQGSSGPPPPLAKRAAPVVKQTRSSLLLQKKKQAEQAPPPPMVGRKPVTRNKPPAIPVRGLKKGAAKPPAITLTAPTPKARKAKKAPPPGFRGFGPADDVDEYLDEFRGQLQELQDDYEQQARRFRRRLPEIEDQPRPVAQPVAPPPDTRHKTQLSKIARQEKQRIPKAHGAAVEAEMNIHMSPEAKRFLNTVIDVTTERPTTMRHPQPKLTQRRRAADVPDQGALEEEPTAHTVAAPTRTTLEYATKESAPKKDPRLVDLFNETLDNSYGLEDIDMDFANISGQDVDDLMPGLEAPQSEDEDDFEAQERQIEAEMIARGEDPYEKPGGPGYDDMEAMDRRESLDARIQAQELALDQAAREPVVERSSPLPRRSPQRAREIETRDRALQQVLTTDRFPPRISPRTPQSAGADEAEMEAMARRASLDARVQAQELALQQVSPGPTDRAQTLEAFPAGDESWTAGPDFFQEEAAPTEEEWTTGPAFFQEADKRFLGQLSSAQKMKEVFPGVRMDEEVDIDEELFPGDFFESQQAKELEALKQAYREYHDTTPANSGVPVTVPRVSISPGTRDAYRRQMQKYLASESEMWVPPKKYTIPFPPSPPHLEDEIQIPTDVEEVTSKLPPEAYQFQYDSPGTPEYVAKKPIPAVDLSQVSPENKLWWTDLRAMQEKMHGRPPKELPDVFDLPHTTRLTTESPPRDWAAPVSPEASPVNMEDLKRKMYTKSRVPGKGRPYEGRVGGVTVNRWSHPTDLSVQPIPEQPEPPPYFTWEDEELRENLAQHQPITKRQPIQFPYKKARRLRGSQHPGLRNIREEYESPEHRYPDVIDTIGVQDYTPPLWTQDLPPEFASPVSPHVEAIDTEQLARDVAQGARGPEYGPLQQRGRGRALEGMPTTGTYPTKGRPPRLGYVSEAMEGMDPSEWAHLGTISAAPGRTESRRAPKVSRPPGLPGLPTSPIEYPPSPVTRRPAPESPGRYGPQRMSLRRKLKKRRLDFSTEPTDDAEVDVEEVETEVEERALPPHVDVPELLSPETTHALRVFYGVSPLREYEGGESQGTPRTPGTEFVPGILEEELPEVEDLPEFMPASPLSEYGVVEGFVGEIREHTVTKAETPKSYGQLKRRWKTRPGKRLEQVTEVPLEEEVHKLHEVVEAEVEEELAQEAATRRAAEANILDEPVPDNLRSPMRPPMAVPFWETPPHLKPIQITRKPDYSVGRTANLLFGTRPYREEMDELADFERLERMTDTVHSHFNEPSPVRQPARMTELSPQRVLRTAQAQYDQLRTPPKTLEQLYNEICAMPPSPEFLRQQEEYRRAEEAAAQQAAAEQAAAQQAALAPPVKRPSKWARAPKMAPRQLRKTLKQQAGPGAPAAPTPAPAPAPTVQPKQAKPRRGKLREPPNRKPLYQPPAPKASLPSVASKASVKSTASQKSVPPKRKSRYNNVASTLDTGMRRRPKPSKPPERPVMPVEMASLADLGLTDADLQNASVVEAEAAGVPDALSPPFMSGLAQRQDLFEEDRPDLMDEVFDPNFARSPVRRTQPPPAPRTMQIRSRTLPMRGVMPPDVEQVYGDEQYDTPERIPSELVLFQQRAQQEAAEAFRRKYAGELGLPESPQYRMAPPSENLFDETMDWDPQLMGDEPGTNIMDVVSPAGHLFADEREAVDLAESMTEGGHEWGGTSPMPQDRAGFNWLSPTKIVDDKMPWDEDFDSTFQ